MADSFKNIGGDAGPVIPESALYYDQATGYIGIDNESPSTLLEVGDTDSNGAVVTLQSDTSANTGPRLDFKKGGTTTGLIGNYGSIIGGSAANLTIYTGDEMYIFAGNASEVMGFDYLGSTRVGAHFGEVSAKLEVVSTTQGFLPPRMTTTQRNAISSPAAGLQVFNTSTGQMEYYNGSSWVAM